MGEAEPAPRGEAPFMAFRGEPFLLPRGLAASCRHIRRFPVCGAILFVVSEHVVTVDPVAYLVAQVSDELSCLSLLDPQVNVSARIYLFQEFFL